MYEHFDNIRKLYGDAYVQIPNGIFRDLAESIKSRNKTNIQQVSFAYAYLVTIAFLYKYAHFVDVDNGTYIQNSDIKEILGYGKTTKTIDKVIKKEGILEQLGLIQTTKDYPISVEYTDEKVNDINMREFITISQIANTSDYTIIKEIVKNKNYEVKEPTFFFDYDEDTGSLYNYANTHKVTLNEFLQLVQDNEMDNVDFLMYFFFKYKCYGLPKDTKSLALYKIVLEIGIGRDAFYNHLARLEKKGYVNSIRKGWRVAGDKHDSEIEANEYIFKGIL
jgi:hypothetical protein